MSVSLIAWLEHQRCPECHEGPHIAERSTSGVVYMSCIHQHSWSKPWTPAEIVDSAHVRDHQRFADVSGFEVEFQTKLNKELTDRGIVYFHDFDSRRNNAGVPDIIILAPRRVIFAELKKGKTERGPAGRVKPKQRLWLSGLAERGEEVYVWYADRHPISLILDIIENGPFPAFRDEDTGQIHAGSEPWLDTIRRRKSASSKTPAAHSGVPV
jgi:hypothetical protein